MAKVTVLAVLLLKMVHCFAQSDWTFLIYNAHKNRCLGSNLQRLDVCDPHSPKQQFRWTSEKRIFNIAEKKCLGTGVKSEGNKLQWYICDANSDLQKWECQSNSLFGLKNESLYLSVQGDSYLLTLSRDPGEKGKWTIHGMMDSVCSRPYEEMYTLKGNAFGRPCQFPFRFKKKWYAECTTEESPNLPWCAIESEYEPNQLWGYCPTRQRADDFWKKNPLTNVYYQVNDQSALTWYQARKSCQQQGADLLSITEPLEQAFILGSTLSTGSVLWTGLNSLDASSGWRWVNGQPLRYLKWLSGQPSSLPGHSCGVLSQLHGSEWSTAVCSERHGYICQRGLPTPTVPPVVHTGSCYSPWIPYSGHCYLLSRTKRTWMEAKDACRREGGDLLSVLNVEEQSFTISQLGYTKTDELWIGLNDLKTSMLFEWSDHSSVPFILWDVKEPSHSAALKEDCVMMRGEEGKWADQTCQKQYGYICKKTTHLNPSTNDTVVTNPGCKPGWVRYGYYCYLAGSETKTFEEAKQMCEKTGSNLVDIANRVENAFLISLIGARPEKYFWIGLSNQRNRYTFEWTNTNKVSFTHFNVGMPGQRQGCVAVTTGLLAGLWDVLSCTNAEKYICKKKAEGLITTPPPPTTPAASCSEGWDPVPERDLCYKLFSVEESQWKTWSEALDFCRELGGDLLSMHSSFEIEVEDISSSTAWIGYSIQDPSVGYTWSDGSSSSFENWEDGEPDNLNNVEQCVAVVSHWWRNTNQWNDLHCESKCNWLCEIRKGVTPKEVKITEKMYNKTEDGWIIFKDNQYHVSEDRTSIEDARRFCRHRHGDLVSINDEEERVFLWHQIKLLYYNDVYIGMRIDMDKSLMWMDGSPVVFQAWEIQQPAFLNNDEHCVKMTYSQGLWQSLNCGDSEMFVCKRSGSVPVNATAAPTAPPIGGCAPDWVKFQDKCYKVHLEEKTWMDARSFCMQLGGNLASVTNSLQQAVLLLQMADDNFSDLWLGLNNLADSRFKWTDGSPVAFTDWSTEDSGYYAMESLCATMGGRQRVHPGKWVNKDCNETSGYICSRALDHLIIPSPTEVPKTFIKLGNSSYMLVQTNMTWKEAQSHCETVGANLASIRDNFAKSYIDLQTYSLGQPLWIGLNSMKTHGYYLWADNWHLRMEQWAPNEPKRDHPCVYVDVDGMWKSAQCNQTYYSLCKKSTDIAPPSPTQYPGVCPEPSSAKPRMIWLPFREHCYAFTNSAESWYTASHICKIRGGELASIVDMKEAEFIENNIRLRKDLSSYFWIGLYKSQREHWLWIDNSVVDYINWAESEKDSTEYVPVYSYGRVRKKNCAVISARTSQWEKHDCSVNLHSYICKTAKVVRSTTKPTPTGSAGKALRPFSGVSVAVLIAALCVLTGLVYGYYRSSRKQASTYENSMQDIREGLVQEDEDTRGLVSQIERNEEAPAL